MPGCRVGEIDLHYERAGSGPPLLFISGSGSDLRQKPNVLDGPFPRHFDTLTYDQRGLGRSSRPDVEYSMGDYAEDAAGLLDALGWERCAVVGVSFGGMVAQELAVRHAERIERMVLCCTSSGGAGGASYPLHELEALPADERALRSIEIADTRCGAQWREANPDALARVLDMQSAKAAVGAGDPAREAGFRRQLEARRGHDVWDHLPGLDMPVLICGGHHDGIAPPSNQRALAQRIPGSTLEMFDGGHLFMLQDRAAFPRMIEFLEGDSPGS